jgi:hypothetical protein
MAARQTGDQFSSSAGVAAAPSYDLREIFNAILYLNRTGIPWRYPVRGSLANGAPVQLWEYTAGGPNQQWLAAPGTGGTFHFVNRDSTSRLEVPGSSTADGVQLQQRTCDGIAAQSFRLTAV